MKISKHVIDLGAASIETQGFNAGIKDEVLGQLEPGLSRD